jgi:adhesin transport system outer membrane protein
MSIKKDIIVNSRTWKIYVDIKWLFSIVLLSVPITHAETPREQYHTLKNNLSQLFAPKSNEDFKIANMQRLSNFSFNSSSVELPVVSASHAIDTVPSAFGKAS